MAIIWLLFVVFLASCANTAISRGPGIFTEIRETTEIRIRIHPVSSLYDESVLAEKMSDRTITRVMVVPPSGTAGAAFNRGLSNAERALMRLGVELISPAIGGRAVGSRANEGNGAGAGLSDLERVLVLAEQSHAEAVLQIGDLLYENPDTLLIDHRSSEGFGGRYVVLDDKTQTVEEVSPEAYDRISPSRRWRFVAPTFVFTAKLIDVSDGAILASYQYRSDLAKSLHRPYSAALVLPVRQLQTTSWDWLERSWTDEARANVIAEIFSRIGATLTN